MRLASVLLASALPCLLGCGNGDDAGQRSSSGGGASSMGGSSGSPAAVPTRVLTGPPVAADSFGAPEELTSGLNFPVDLALDQTHVYATLFGGSGGNAVVRVPKQGAGVEALRSAELRVVSELEVDASHVYWSDSDGLWRGDKAGGVAAELVVAWSPARFSVTPHGLFFARGRTAGLQPFSGEAHTVLTSSLPTGSAFNGALAADAERGFLGFTDATDPVLPTVLWSWTLADGQMHELWRGFGAINAMTSDGTHVYVLGDDQLFRTPVTGGVIEILAELSFTSRSLAVDAEHAYVIERGLSSDDCHAGQGRLWAVRKDGGELTLLVDALTCPYRVAADASGVYWSVAPVVRSASEQTVPGSIARLAR